MVRSSSRMAALPSWPAGSRETLDGRLAQRIDFPRRELRTSVADRRWRRPLCAVDLAERPLPPAAVQREGGNGNGGAWQEVHAMQETRRARELFLLVRGAPVQLLGHDAMRGSASAAAWTLRKDSRMRHAITSIAVSAYS
jgi:hypothetical protein